METQYIGFLFLAILFAGYHLYGFYDTISLIRFENGLVDGKKTKFLFFALCKSALVVLPFMEKGFHFLALFTLHFVWVHYKMYHNTNPTVYIRLFKNKNAFNFMFFISLLLYYFYI